MAVDEISEILDRLDAAYASMTLVLDRNERIEEADLALRQFTGNALIQAITEECAERMDVTIAAATILNAEMQIVIASTQSMLPDCLRSNSYCQFVVGTGKPLMIPDTRKSAFLRRMPSDQTMKSYLGVPLLAPDGERLGAFCALHTEKRKWTKADLTLLTAYSANVTGILADGGM